MKTTTLAPAVLPPPPPSLSRPKSDSTQPDARLEPPPGPIAVPQGCKVFVNIAWDPNVPPPPEGTDEDVRRAMEGTDYATESEEGGWYVPVIVSNAREDVDKGKHGAQTTRIHGTDFLHLVCSWEALPAV